MPTNVVDLGREQVLRHFRWIEGHADTWAMLADAEALSAVVRGLAHLAAQQHPDVVVDEASDGVRRELPSITALIRASELTRVPRL